MTTNLFEKADMTAMIEQPADVQPLSIIHRAVAAGADPDQLDKLLTLQERWEKNEARKAYNRAMKACQEEMPAVAKNSLNEHTNKRYANLDAVATTIKPIYTRHGFSLSYGEGQSGEGQIAIVCKCMHESGHTEEFTLNCPYDNTGAKGGQTKTAIQGMGSSVSYGRRYLLLMIFNVIISDEDDDGGAMGTISENEVQELDHWLGQLNRDAQTGFFEWIGVGSLDKIAAGDFNKALGALKAKVNKMKAGR